MPFPDSCLRQAPVPAAGLSSRADVALFVGLVPRRPGATVPAGISRLAGSGGLGGKRAVRPVAASGRGAPRLPVPIESWGAFDHLFAWECAPDRARQPRALALPAGAGGAQLL